MINRVILVGRLTQDPQMRKTNTGRSVCSFTLAVSRPKRQNSTTQEADFINCVAWEKTAELMCSYLRKGSQIGVEGRIQTRNYDNNEGRKVYVTEVVASNVQFLESKNAQATNNSFNAMPEPPMEKTPYDFANDNQSQTSNTETMDTEKDPFASFGEQVEISDNDLPF